jgi:hypothetical protein
METPQYPAGSPPSGLAGEGNYDEKRKAELIGQIERAPGLLREAVAGLSAEQLNTLYKNWTLRQITHHLADSHVNSYVRFKWALTEDQPLIKAYDENLWSALSDAKTGDVEPALHMMEGMHDRWVQLLKSMTPGDYQKTFRHPDGRIISLSKALGIYAWHGRHHTAQIQWVRNQRAWN